MSVWDEDSTKKLIEAFRVRPFLWEANPPQFTSELLISKALGEIADMLNMPIEEVQEKVRSIKMELKKEARADDGGPHSSKLSWMSYNVTQFFSNNRGACGSKDGKGKNDKFQSKDPDANPNIDSTTSSTSMKEASFVKPTRSSYYSSADSSSSSSSFSSAAVFPSSSSAAAAPSRSDAVASSSAFSSDAAFDGFVAAASSSAVAASSSDAALDSPVTSPPPATANSSDAAFDGSVDASSSFAAAAAASSSATFYSATAASSSSSSDTEFTVASSSATASSSDAVFDGSVASSSSAAAASSYAAAASSSSSTPPSSDASSSAADDSPPSYPNLSPRVQRWLELYNVRVLAFLCGLFTVKWDDDTLFALLIATKMRSMKMSRRRKTRVQSAIIRKLPSAQPRQI